MKEPKIIKIVRTIFHRQFYLALFCFGLVLQAGVVSQADEYHLKRGANSSAKFLSEAPFEDIVGITDKIDGYVLWAGKGLDNNTDFTESEFYFEVELTGLETGIGLRDRHMRDNYLEVDQFPYASYEGKIVKFVVDSANYFTATCEGMFSIHGEQKAVTILTSIQETETALMVQCQFDLKLSDYNIKIPSLMFLKINENIQLFLDFYLKEVTN